MVIKNGLLVENNNKEELTSSICRLIEDNNICRQLSKKCKR